MFKHIVCMDFKADCKDKLKKAQQKFYALEKKLDIIKTCQVGLDELFSDRSYDLILIIDFESREDWVVYNTHPEHVKVKKFIHENREKSVSVDFAY
jgi:hypothetical protein